MRAVRLIRHWQTVPVAANGRQAVDPRGWDWFYMMSLGQQDLRTIALDGSGSAAAWSPDGRWLAVGGGFSSRLHFFETPSDSLGNVDVDRIHEVATRRHSEGYHGAVQRCDWSPDSSLLLTGCDDKSLRVWEAGTWNEVVNVPCDSPVRGLRWRQNEGTIASGHENGTVTVRDSGTGEVRLSVDALSGRIKDMAWSPDADRVVVGLVGQAAVLDAASGTVLTTIPGTSDCVAWFDDLIVLGQSEGEIVFWDAKSQQLLHQAFDHSVPASEIRFSPDGSKVASADERGIIHVYDVATMKRSFTLCGHTDKIDGLCWSPDGRVIASAAKDDTLKFWPTSPDQQQLPIDTSIDAIVWHPRQKTVAVTTGSTGVFLCDPLTKDIVQSIDVPAHWAAWNADGTMLALAYKSRGDIVIWNVEDQKEADRISHGFEHLQKLTWGPGKHIAVSHAHGFEAWREETLQSVHSVSGYRGGCAVSPDGKRVAVTTRADTLELRDTDSWTCKTLELADTDGDALCWNPMGTKLAISTHFGINIVDAATGNTLVTLSGHAGEVQSLHWHPFEDRLASGSKDKTVRIWDTQTGSELLTLADHTDEVNAVAWSPDGMSLVTGSEDETAVLHDLSKYYQLHR